MIFTPIHIASHHPVIRTRPDSGSHAVCPDSTRTQVNGAPRPSWAAVTPHSCLGTNGRSHVARPSHVEKTASLYSSTRVYRGPVAINPPCVHGNVSKEELSCYLINPGKRGIMQSPRRLRSNQTTQVFFQVCEARDTRLHNTGIPQP